MKPLQQFVNAGLSDNNFIILAWSGPVIFSLATPKKQNKTYI